MSAALRHRLRAQRAAIRAHAPLRDVFHPVAVIPPRVDDRIGWGVVAKVFECRPPGVVHHMALDVELDRALTIVGVDAAMHAIPFEPSEETRGEGCRNILPNYQWLIGTPLDAGYALRVMETVGGRLGCFHILSLAQCLPLAVRAASGRLCGEALRMPEASRDVVRDSCAEWRAESPATRKGSKPEVAKAEAQAQSWDRPSGWRESR